jgi:hypothetical protein
MPTINSRASVRLDRLLGYLGLFLIGLIGWVCDRVAVRLPARRSSSHNDWSGGGKPDTTYRRATQARERSLRPGQREHAGLPR